MHNANWLEYERHLKLPEMLFIEDVSILSFLFSSMTCVVVVVQKKLKCQSYKLYKHVLFWWMINMF